MSGPGSHRATVTLFVDGIEDKHLPQIFVNFSHSTLDGFRKHVMTLCRLHPKEPLYECESITISDKEIDMEYLNSILSSIAKGVAAGKIASKLKLIVKGKLPVSTPGRLRTGIPRKPPTPSFRTPSMNLSKASLPVQSSSSSNLDESFEEDPSAAVDVLRPTKGSSNGKTAHVAGQLVSPLSPAAKRKVKESRLLRTTIDMYQGGLTAAESHAKFSDNLRSSVTPEKERSCNSKRSGSNRDTARPSPSSWPVIDSARSTPSPWPLRAISRSNASPSPWQSSEKPRCNSSPWPSRDLSRSNTSLWSSIDDKDRPSMATICSQWEFMRSNFVNNSEEELEWLMVSKKPGAYKHANDKNCAAEDRYFKSLSDIETYEYQRKRTAEAVELICPVLSSIAAEQAALSADSTNEQALNRVAVAQAILIKNLKIITAVRPRELKWELKSSVRKLLVGVATNRQGAAAARVAHNMVEMGTMCLDDMEPKVAIAAAVKASEEALKAMEKWGKREKETDEYAQVVRDEEAAWMLSESDANNAALATMRSYIPLNIAEMSVKELREAVVAKGGLMTLELATELKANRLLQWVTLHTADIAVDNFLNGDKKHFFLNLEKLDVVELRALVAVMPLKFELDGNGNKAEWRERFMTRAKQLISQQSRQVVKGGWDRVNKCRSTTKMNKLKSDLERRPLYFYPTEEQCKVRLTQFDTRDILLAKKQAYLEKVTAETLSCKSEYDTLLREMRDPEVKAFFGADQVAGAKESAKKDWISIESQRKALATEVTRLLKSITDSPLNREQYAQSMEDIRLHLLGKDQQWSNEDKKMEAIPGQSTACPSPSQSAPIVIEGVFDATVAVERVLRLAAKFVTAEEEAESRREEIEALKKRREMPSETTTTDTAAFEETCSVKENSIDCSETIDETTVEMTSLGTADPDWVSADADSITPKNMSRCLSSEALECPDSPHPGCPTPFGPSASSPSPYSSSCDSMSMRHVLSSVDPELIARLNKLLLPKDKVTSALSCSPSGRSTPSPSRGEADLSPEDREQGREDLIISAIKKKDTETDASTHVILDSCAFSPYRTALSPYRATRAPRRASSGPHCATLSTNRAILSPCRTDISPFRTVLSTAQAQSSVPVPDYVRPPLPFKGSQSKLLQKLQALREEQELRGIALCTPLGGEPAPIPCPPVHPVKMGFLDQIKSRKATVKPLSFLDQIKARNQE